MKVKIKLSYGLSIIYGVKEFEGNFNNKDDIIIYIKNIYPKLYEKIININNGELKKTIKISINSTIITNDSLFKISEGTIIELINATAGG